MDYNDRKKAIGFLLSVPYFDGLFSISSFTAKLGVHNNIDFIIFSMFKARLCFISYMKQNDFSEDYQDELIGEYDALQYLSFGCWIDKYAPEFELKTEIIETRLTAYEQIFMNKSIHTWDVMSCISMALYWFLDNGWQKNSQGQFTFVPNDFSIEKLLDYNASHIKYNHYTDYLVRLEPLMFGYCELNIPSLINYIEESRSTASKTNIFNNISHHENTSSESETTESHGNTTLLYVLTGIVMSIIAAIINSYIF